MVYHETLAPEVNRCKGGCPATQSVRQAITLIYGTALTWQTLPFVDIHRMWIDRHGVGPRIEPPYQSLLHPIGALHQQDSIWVSSSTEPKHV
jgi:hypothetical protein